MKDKPLSPSKKTDEQSRMVTFGDLILSLFEYLPQKRYFELLGQIHATRPKNPRNRDR
jgi:hypothetical protein